MFDFKKSDEEVKAFEQKQLSELTVAQFRVLMGQILEAHGMKKATPANSLPVFRTPYDKLRQAQEEGLRNPPRYTGGSAFG